MGVYLFIKVADTVWFLLYHIYCLKSYYIRFGWRTFSAENSVWNTAIPLLRHSYMFQFEICSQQLEICKSVCMFIVLAIALWRLINFQLFCSDDSRSWPREEKLWSDDCRLWPREEKINNHGCWCKHAHIPDNDYSGICLFHVVWTNLFL